MTESVLAPIFDALSEGNARKIGGAFRTEV